MSQQSYKDAEFWTPEISFLGEQDGPPERELKNVLSNLFKTSGEVQLAYLARVTYDKQEENVALCLKTSPDVQEQKVMTRIAEIFSGMFNRNEQLDIVFLTEKNQKQIAEVCPPFFVLNLT